MLFVGVAIALLAYGAHQNSSHQTAQHEVVDKAMPRIPNWLARTIVRVVPLGTSALFIVSGVTIGILYVGAELKYLTLGPSERVEIISAEVAGAENTALTVEMSTGEQRSLTVRYKDYLLDENEVTVFPETNPLQAKSRGMPLGPWEATASTLCGLVLGIAILDRWVKWKGNS